MRWPIAALFCVLAGAASAAMQVNIGVLTCTLAPSGERGEAPDSQTLPMVCDFKPNGTGPEERYEGEIRNVGSQTALSGKRVLIWVVMGPADRELPPGQLGQTYVGKLASSADDDGQPEMLIGESDDAYALRPMSDNGGETGPGNITVVVLKVKSIPT